MRRLAENEDGFGLIELLFAMVILNVGIFALIATFQSGALAVSRSAATTNGTVVADKVMEVFRDLRNCAIYLHGNGSGTDNGTTGLPDGIPKSTSTWYTSYQGDTAAYANTTNGANQTAFYSYTSQPTSAPQWVTEYTPASTPVTTYCSTGFPAAGGSLSTFAASTGIDPTQAVQKVTGPDGQSYPVLIYIILLQSGGTGYTGGYVKQVTVAVRNPLKTTQTLARESSVFDPNVAP